MVTQLIHAYYLAKWILIGSAIFVGILIFLYLYLHENKKDTKNLLDE
jgi:hypothetical protein